VFRNCRFWIPEITLVLRSVGQLCLYTGWSKSCTVDIKIVTDDCTSVQFNWIYKCTISLWLYKSSCRSRNVVTCLCQSMSSDSKDARMSLSPAQQVFIVKHCMASRSQLTCKNEFRDAFPNSPVPNGLTVPCVVNHFCDTASMLDSNPPSWPSVLNDDGLDDIHQTLLHSGHFHYFI
jgi:hypothetical protein